VELEKIKGKDLDLEEIIKKISKFNTKVKNNGGGAFNHSLFWKMLSPKKQTLKDPLLSKINKSFGSLDEFKKVFEEEAKNRFGSGWVWLVLTKGNVLKIMTTGNQENPLMNSEKNGGYPLLGLDLWEHAYYLKYKNERDKYIHNFWKVVNWEFVNDQYISQTNKKPN
jgi:Fe-Mn family superoxide dismutase